MKNKKWIGFLSVILVSLVVLAGCGAKKGGYAAEQTMNLAADAPLDTLDVSKANGYGQTGNVFESLYRLGKNGKTTPGLASEAKVSKDGLTWTFKIRKNAKFSDGSKITAHDFVYSWQRTINPKTKALYAYLFEGIKNADQINAGKMDPSKLGVEAKDDQTFVVHLDQPIHYFKVLMSYPLFSPISQKAVEKYGDKYGTKAQYTVYSGPFKVKGWTGTNDTWSFVKNPQYWDKKVVKLDQIKFRVVENPQTKLNLYQSGKLDYTQLSSEQVKNYKNNKDYTTFPYSITTFLQYNFNDADKTKRKAFNNVNIRKAIAYSINRKQLIEKIIGDASTPSKGLVPTDLANNPKTGKDFADDAYLEGTIEYNQKQAKQYWEKGLQEIGVKNLKLNLTSDNEGNSKNYAEFYAQSLEKTLPGLQIHIVNVPSQVAYSRSQSGEFDILVGHWGADFNDPISHLQILQKNSAYNYGKWDNTEYNSLVKKAQNEDANNAEKRWQDMIKAEQIVMKEQAVSPLYQTVYSYLKNPKVKGVIHNTAGTQWNYKYAYITN
ncbi:peptide ABC transporter substrate-binding protein [Pediococcus pentosaceus]|uniref:peptide ABC transporter substrate-binding protein n=1 Tax=Pediococcus pentosaceus TaxID=1255 RepID=UPI00223B7825|nr:peptide ABC transporter substrate-binding protein [Pediococcus pentosaceus]MCT1175341.1 peptide ABC transporter substrate-binding protein [Pediococcus pentosaceus]